MHGRRNVLHCTKGNLPDHIPTLNELKWLNRIPPCACRATLTNAVRARQHPQILCVYGNTHKCCACTATPTNTVRVRQHSQILCVYSNTHNRAYFLGILSLGPLASSDSELSNSPLTFGENFMTISVHRRAGHNYNTRTDTHWIHCSSIPAVQEQIGLKSAQTL